MKKILGRASKIKRMVGKLFTRKYIEETVLHRPVTGYRVNGKLVRTYEERFHRDHRRRRM